MGTDDAWVSYGTLFLILYVLAVVAVAVAGSRLRGSVRRARAVHGRYELRSRPEDLAYLNAGPDLAVWSALAALHADGAIRAIGPGSSGGVRAGRALPPGSGPLRGAIHAVAAHPVQRDALGTRPRVAVALDETRGRLERAGLLLTAAQRRVDRWPVLCMLVLLALGATLIVAGLVLERPIVPLLVATAAAGALGLRLLPRPGVPARTAAGDRAVEFHRVRNPALAPAMRPDWNAIGSDRAALSVGAFGVGALRASAPVFAAELGARRTDDLGGRPSGAGRWIVVRRDRGGLRRGGAVGDAGGAGGCGYGDAGGCGGGGGG